MDFTREPIIESVMTPKEGCKLVVRSSKGSGQEEFFVDAVEIVSFGHALFFRSLEKPKPFLVPVSDYEVLEAREARLVLKNVGIERSTIKIGGGREPRHTKEPVIERSESYVKEEEPKEVPAEQPVEAKNEQRLDKKRDRRKHYRRKRGRDELSEKGEDGEDGEHTGSVEEGYTSTKNEAESLVKGENGETAQKVSMHTSILPPPTTLISETIARYRDNALFKDAFFEKEEEQLMTDENDEQSSAEFLEDTSTAYESHPEDVLEVMDMQNASLEESSFGFFESTAINQEDNSNLTSSPQENTPKEPIEPNGVDESLDASDSDVIAETFNETVNGTVKE